MKHLFDKQQHIIKNELTFIAKHESKNKRFLQREKIIKLLHSD